MGRLVLVSGVSGVAIGACSLMTPLDGLTGGVASSGPRSDGGPEAATDSGMPRDDSGSPSPGDAGFVSAYRTVVMSDAPVVYYRLGDSGGSAKDETGAHPGTVIGTISHGPGAIAGDPDGALVGDGTGWIDIAQIFPFTGNAAYSIEAWAAPNNSATLTGILSRNLATPGNPPNDGYSFYIETNLAPTLGRWRSGNEQAASGPGLPAGTFTYLVGTYDGSTLKVYVNGELKGSAPATQAIITPPTDLSIGATRNGTYGYFVGSLDEVALYDKALMPERIAAHYAVGRGK
jgi:hypothetical protein